MKNDQSEIKLINKKWGFEKWIVNNDLYCGKLLYFVKDHYCSLHMHKIKKETFYVQSGKVLILYNDDFEETKKWVEKAPQIPGKTYRDFLDSIILTAGENFHVPVGRLHQIIALHDTELFEFSTKHEDSDSYRLTKSQ